MEWVIMENSGNRDAYQYKDMLLLWWSMYNDDDDDDDDDDYEQACWKTRVMKNVIVFNLRMSIVTERSYSSPYLQHPIENLLMSISHYLKVTSSWWHC